MLWFLECYDHIQYFVYTYLGIDITLFSDYEKLMVIIGCNLMVLVTLFIMLYIFKHVIYKFMTYIC